MQNEKKFTKYESRGPDYHYKQINKKSLNEFNAFVYARYQIELELIIKILIAKKSQNMKILDVGCGDGVILYLLNQKLKNENMELYGIDSSDLALKIAKRKIPRGIFKIAEVYNLPYEDNFFDLIISSDVIEHVLRPDKMLSEIKRVGKDNSHVVIGTPIRITEKPLDKMHQHEYFPNEYKTLLSEYFSDIRIIQSHKLVYFLLYEKISSILGKKISIFRKIINLLSIYLNKNPFLKIKDIDIEKYSYMFGMCKI